MVGGGIIEDGTARGREDFLTPTVINTDDESGGAERLGLGMTETDEISLLADSTVTSEHLRTLEKVIGDLSLYEVGEFGWREFRESQHGTGEIIRRMTRRRTNWRS